MASGDTPKYRNVAVTLLTVLAIGTISTILITNVQPKGFTIDKVQADNGASPNLVATSTPSSLPNIIFVLADDMGFNSISSGVSPFLYDLQQRSVALTNYYAQETCTPGRAALLTGRYPLSIGAQFAEYNVALSGGLSLDETLIPEIFKDNGYVTYLMGKWNLGNSSPANLPTARGFSYYLGFLDGFSTYWSKLIPDNMDYKDFMFSNSDCFYMYDSEDSTLYSTFIYEDKAVAAIQAHDFSSPMFMLLAFQAVHDPFGDDESGHSTGIPKSYLSSTVHDYIMETYPGTVEREYMKSLAVLDTAVSGIFTALESNGVLSNTYIIFASDNGGCPGGGGRNTPLRGTKGSLFEGGLHVESFIFSQMLTPMNYTALFHVTDWFPTMLALAGLKYSPDATYELDGVSHFENFISTNTTMVREYMLYNYYHESLEAELYPNTAFAVRNQQYKLMHTYDSAASEWYNSTTEYADSDDAIFAYASCSQSDAIDSGTYTHYLFDLVNDPYETTNLYNSSLKLKKIQNILYTKLAEYANNAHVANATIDSSGSIYTTWKEYDYYAVPWQTSVDVSTLLKSKANATAPVNCGLYSLMSDVEYHKIPAFVNVVNPLRTSE